MHKRSLVTLAVLFCLLLLRVNTAESQVHVIESEDYLPKSFCSTCEKGDFLISFGKHKAVVGGVSRVVTTSSVNCPLSDARGCILSFPPLGGRQVSNIAFGCPYLRLRSRGEYFAYSSVEDVSSSDGAPTVRAVGTYSNRYGEKARSETTYQFIEESGRIDIRSIVSNVGDRVLEDFTYSIYVDAGTLYSFRPRSELTVYAKHGTAFVWMDRSTGEPPKALAPRESYRVQGSMMVGTSVAPLLRKAYGELGVETETATIQLKKLEEGPAEIVITDPVSDTAFFRSILADVGKVEVPLPAGTYRIRANFYPAIREALFRVLPGEVNSVELEDAHKGVLSVRIENNAGEFIPGKVTFIGLDPTSSPYFRPIDPMASGRSWERRKNSRFPGSNGMDVVLPVGTYMVYASRGPEYSLDGKVVEVIEGETKPLMFRIERVVDTTGLVSVDPHMHTQWSDGNMSMYERLRSVVAEGVDVAVSSDHNTVTDYEPQLLTSGLDEYLAVIHGNEVTISGMIHYNTFPVAYREDEEMNGAIPIDPVKDLPGALFHRSRSKDPGTIIQINHPRSGTLGYFNMYELDRESAASAIEGFDTTFDILEVVNGPVLGQANQESIEDWLHLLNRGFFFPLTGSSDSHGIDGSEPGYSRTYVYYAGEKGSQLDQASVVQAIKEGRSFSSNGPIIDLLVNDTCRSGDTCPDGDGVVDVRIRAQNASWVAVDELRLIVNGERRDVPFTRKPGQPLDMTLEVQILLEEDAYVVLEALGKSSLYPVTQTSSATNEWGAILPYALTNPVFVDVDQNGTFDPPLGRELKLLQEKAGN
jgi:hypothetical protein